MFLPGLATACVDNTTGDIFNTPASVAVDMRKEMVGYLTQRSESFLAESVILEAGPDHPYDVVYDFVDDFAISKRNLFDRVSGWVMSENREEKIDDFVQEMEINGFWLLDGREAIEHILLKNVDFKNAFHCDKKFMSAEGLAEHVCRCIFRPMTCTNGGCNARFCASHLERHGLVCLIL
jgi:homogentisate solanesyltransferase